jgi:hypothetical protein
MEFSYRLAAWRRGISYLAERTLRLTWQGYRFTDALKWGTERGREDGGLAQSEDERREGCRKEREGGESWE